MTKQRKLLLQTEQVDPLWNQPFEMGIEGIIATIEDKDELRKALIEYVTRTRG
jgi:hypothetical protein